MERSEWDDDEQYPAAPLPPHERAWRHPSELGDVHVVRNEPPLALGRGLMVATGAIGGLLALAVLWAMLPASSEAPSASATVSRLTTQEVVRPTRTTASVRSSITSSVATTAPRSTVASSLAATLAPATSTTAAAPAEPTATVHLVASDPAAELSNAVALAGTGMLVTTAKAIGTDRDVQVTMGDQVIAAKVVLLDAVSGVAVLEPASDSGVMPFTVAGCSPGDHVRVLGDTPFEADLAEAEGGHMRLDADGWAREGTPVVDHLGHLVGLYSTTARGQEVLRVDRVSGVAPTATSDPATSTSTVAPSSSLTGSTSSEVTSTGPTTTQAGTTTSTVAPPTTLRAMPVWLGVQADETPSGLTVTAVADGGPAAAAGVTAGDVIVELAGVPVSVRADVAGVLGARAPGDTISVTVLRDGTPLDLSAVLAPRPSL